MKTSLGFGHKMRMHNATAPHLTNLRIFQVRCLFVAEHIRSLSGSRARLESALKLACDLVSRFSELPTASDEELLEVLQQLETIRPTDFLPPSAGYGLNNPLRKAEQRRARISLKPRKDDNQPDYLLIDPAKGYVPENCIVVCRKACRIFENAQEGDLEFIAQVFRKEGRQGALQ